MEIDQYFIEVADFRVQGRCLHQMNDILSLVLCGIIADCDDFVEIKDSGAGYVIALKTNQGALYEEVYDFMLQRTDVLAQQHTSIDKAHSRGETQEVWVCQNLDLVEESTHWKDLHTLLLVQRMRLVGDQVQEQTQFYITSLKQTAPAIFA